MCGMPLDVEDWLMRCSLVPCDACLYEWKGWIVLVWLLSEACFCKWVMWVHSWLLLMLCVDIYVGCFSWECCDIFVPSCLRVDWGGLGFLDLRRFCWKEPYRPISRTSKKTQIHFSSVLVRLHTTCTNWKWSLGLFQSSLLHKLLSLGSRRRFGKVSRLVDFNSLFILYFAQVSIECSRTCFLSIFGVAFDWWWITLGCLMWLSIILLKKRRRACGLSMTASTVFVPIPVDHRFRGEHCLRRYPTGEERCISCKACQLRLLSGFYSWNSYANLSAPHKPSQSKRSPELMEVDGQRVMILIWPNAFIVDFALRLVPLSICASFQVSLARLVQWMRSCKDPNFEFFNRNAWRVVVWQGTGCWQMEIAGNPNWLEWKFVVLHGHWK